MLVSDTDSRWHDRLSLFLSAGLTHIVRGFVFFFADFKILTSGKGRIIRLQFIFTFESG